MKFDAYLEEFIQLAIREDIGDGDHTALSTIPLEVKGKAQLLVKQNGILCGVDIANKVFKSLDPDCIFTKILSDGTEISPGDIAFTIHGNVISLLQAERITLNIMQRLSGIATETNVYVQELKGLKTKILDTRKTTPGMRLLEKYAVKTGGGVNHRMGLHDLILIKDNHIDFSGSIEQAVKRAKDYLVKNNLNLKIEVEVRSLNDIEKILNIDGIHRILLDNFSIVETKQAVDLINGKIETESSGGITLKTIRKYAECGVDFISVGALTHQIKSLDLSLKAIDY